MLRITIEFIPADGRPAETIGVVDVTNDRTGTPDVGNYNVVARDRRGARVELRLEGAAREAGAWALAADALNAAADLILVERRAEAPTGALPEPQTPMRAALREALWQDEGGDVPGDGKT